MLNKIPKGQKCSSGCGDDAKYFSKETGRYRCLKSWSKCPATRIKNSKGLRKAHKAGKMRSFTVEDRQDSHASHRKKLIDGRPFEKLGKILRKKIVLEEQGNACDHCGLDTWMGLPIAMELDHIDGVRTNDKRDNLRGLCPNCHALTDTYRGRNSNTGKIKATDEELLMAYEREGNINKALKAVGLAGGGNYKRMRRIIAAVA